MSARLASTKIWTKTSKKGKLETILGSDLGDLTLMLYFAKKGSEQSNRLTKLLQDFREEVLVKKGFPVEIMLVSMDSDIKEMLEHYVNEQGQWLAIEYDAVARRDLVKELGVKADPALIVIDKEGKQVVSSKDCIAAVEVAVLKKKNIDADIQSWCKAATGWDFEGAKKNLPVVTSQQEFAELLLDQMNPNRERVELDRSPEAQQARLASLYQQQMEAFHIPGQIPKPGSAPKSKTELRVESPDKIIADLGHKAKKRETLSPEQEQKRLSEFAAAQSEQLKSLAQGFKFESPLYYKQFPDNTYEIVVNASNGLGVELGWTDQSDEQVIVSGFRELPSGTWGPLEATGLVIVGDQIVAINGVPVQGLNMEQIGKLIMKQRSRTQIRFQRKVKGEGV
mmetsp:Transcript_6140/g.7443  ORF Transcript_6140/g.7443 Transcript_6140/m.7443 type:complete len:395 (+) Transcript_6140:283-1467(+)|eukprot:CAMPEP_0184024838 /NCGR_PEP_ID=MMETSP0954-20121128/12377_1 /TAXON_ID=627963 /ORGANISM="Aplanochytrium sp, Strain PBS07" /LENGTH=394 /DNA_ID=CAMNT_0026308355 /DNA_START=273 /DNA_END=1457 /DNA_ORIENTATION=+